MSKTPKLEQVPTPPEGESVVREENTVPQSQMITYGMCQTDSPAGDWQDFLEAKRAMYKALNAIGE